MISLLLSLLHLLSTTQAARLVAFTDGSCKDPLTAVLGPLTGDCQSLPNGTRSFYFDQLDDGCIASISETYSPGRCPGRGGQARDSFDIPALSCVFTDYLYQFRDCKRRDAAVVTTSPTPWPTPSVLSYWDQNSAQQARHDQEVNKVFIGVIAGGSVGGFLLLSCCGIGIWSCLRRRSRARTEERKMAAAAEKARMQRGVGRWR